MDPQVFIDIELSQLHNRVEDYQSRGWRAVNLCGSSVDGQVELIYSFSDNETLENLRLLVNNDDIVPSISDVYLNTFFFENETHDLFGVKFKGIAIDFAGTFYPTSVPTPMNPLSDEAIMAALENDNG
jgi:ech hydrogenase subunit D